VLRSTKPNFVHTLRPPQASPATVTGTQLGLKSNWQPVKFMGGVFYGPVFRVPRYAIGNIAQMP